MASITIDNLKSISHLEFQIPEKQGVYLLAGTNGAGKTTLLTCLWRIGYSDAFKTGFRAANVSGIDAYSQAEICYEVDGNKMTYKKAPQRWCATPRQNTSDYFGRFQYKEVIYIDANKDRISITQNEIKSGRLVDASPKLISEMNKAFSTNRFDNLKRLKNKNGRRWFRYYYAIKNPNTGEIYTEKQFSSGELAVLRIFDNLKKLKEGSLVLIDEGELALHPTAQIELLDYLKEFAEYKQSTVIISTHSSTMISSLDDEHLILLDKSEKETLAIRPCPASRALCKVCPPEIAKAINDLLLAAETKIDDEETKSSIKELTEAIKELGEVIKENRGNQGKLTKTTSFIFKSLEGLANATCLEPYVHQLIEQFKNFFGI